MKNIGVIGLGDMGSGLAKNLMANGFSVFGLDLKPERQAAFIDMGGTLVEDTVELERRVDAAFVMVMNWDQAKSAILGPDGLL
ncbi:MAG: NAD(P)-binding domain-containing protein, partial [Paracoccaceae bacterium]